MSGTDDRDPVPDVLAELRHAAPDSFAGPHLRTEDIEAYLAGSAGDRVEAIELHQIWCPACSSRIERLRRLIDGPSRVVTLDAPSAPAPAAVAPVARSVRPPLRTARWWPAVAAASVLLAIGSTGRLWFAAGDRSGLASNGTTQSVLVPDVPRGGEPARTVVLTLGSRDQLVTFLHEMSPDTEAASVMFTLIDGTTTIWTQASTVTSSRFSRVAIASIPSRLFANGHSYNLQYTEGDGPEARSGTFAIMVAAASR